MRTFRCMLGALPILMVASMGTVPVLAGGINVVVNNQAINFANTTPVEQNGVVLVPLRGVFEALGATVDYNPSSKMIFAHKGDSTVSLSLGSSSASVNGQPETLSQPAEVIDGSTLVPLRFVAEALGAYVQWVPSSQTVQIQTPEAHLSTLPPPPTNQDSSSVVGKLTGVYTDTVPQQITLRVNGDNTAIPITQNTVVLIRDNDQPGVQSDIHDLDIGDQVRVELAQNGSAATIEAVVGEIVGTVKSIQQLTDGSYVVSLNDGTNIQMARDAQVRMSDRHIEFSDVMPDEHVRIRTDEHNRIGYSLRVVTGNEVHDTNTGAPRVQGTSYEYNLPGIGSTIQDVSPAAGSIVTDTRPIIYALLDNPGTVLSSSTVHILLDGRDVSRNATITKSFITYQPDFSLDPGMHTVDVSVNSSIGAWVGKSWRFSTGSQESISFSSNRSGKRIVLTPGETVALILRAEPGGSAFATAGTVRVPLKETTPGYYEGTLLARTDTGLENASVTAHYTSARDADTIAQLAQVITLSTGTPSPPQIKSPIMGQQIGRHIRVTGSSAPGSTVNITVNYATKALGVFALNGTAVQTQTVADSNGQWQTDDIQLSTPSVLSSPHATALTISAVAIDSLGQRSSSSTVKVTL